MNANEAVVPAPESATRYTVYEQPLNERMRAFMRLEFLWQQLSYHAGLPNAWSSRSAVAGLLEILAITSRGDARGDVLKELERQMSTLRDYQNRPGVDGARLRAVLAALMRRREELNAAGANFMQKLRESEFLNAIKHRSAIPGGTCEFDLPAYYAWQQHDATRRRADLMHWISTLTPLAEALNVLLGLLREAGTPQRVVARSGQYQQSLPAGKTYHLLRLRLDGSLDLVPEISGHRLMVSIRLMRAEAEGRLHPVTEDHAFELTLCS